MGHIQYGPNTSCKTWEQIPSEKCRKTLYILERFYQIYPKMDKKYVRANVPIELMQVRLPGTHTSIKIALKRHRYQE